MPDCRFCGIDPALVVHETAECLVFLDYRPVFPGHCLVIPKAHYPTVFDIAPEAMEAVARCTARVAIAVNRAVQPDGLNLIQANGAGAGQSVGHFHLHVFPRRLNDGVAINWDPKPGDHAHIAEIAEIAARIRALL